ncbi:MAG: hypothetical protein IPH32_11355 [Bacteroidetes bacterium]|nr:hypothetical protein [Bacteroidota bacterium]
MVYDNKTKTVITKGGSWNSDFEQCKLYNKEELNGAVKLILGFYELRKHILLAQ